MGPVVEALVPRVLETPQYQQAPPELQRFLLRQVLAEVRAHAKRAAAAQVPELARQVALRGLDRDLATFATGQGLLERVQP
jgi:hypothetical protein